MQRLVLAVLFVTLATSIVAYLAGRVSGSRAGRAASTDAATTGDTMQRTSFFLLMCLMIYVFMNGAS